MQYGDAQSAVPVDVRVVYSRREPELRWREREVVREPHLRFEVPAVVYGVLVQHHHSDVPHKDVRVVLQLDVERRYGLLGVRKLPVLS